jgi:hypothetical protein
MMMTTTTMMIIIIIIIINKFRVTVADYTGSPKIIVTY